jgi:hypothetical protein
MQLSKWFENTIYEVCCVEWSIFWQHISKRAAVRIEENCHHRFSRRNWLFHFLGQFLVDRNPRIRSLSVPENPQFVACPEQISIPPPRHEKFCPQCFCAIDTRDFLSV